MNGSKLKSVLLLVSALAVVSLSPSSFSATESRSQPSGEVALLAGGCFWCIEADLEKLPGVLSVVSGYTGGKVANPSYEQVSAGGTGHAEAVEVRFDPAKLSYAALLDYFWHHIDPTVSDAQFCDRGNQYRSAIFPLGEEQTRIARESKAKLEASKVLGVPVRTSIEPGGTFYPAEDYHQDYYKKNAVRYNFYRYRCGRDERVKAVWGKDAPAGQH